MDSIDYLYKLSTLIVGVECLVMTITIFLLGFKRKNVKKSGTQSMLFFALAIFGMSAINLAEFCFSIETEIKNRLSIVIFASSIELFLFMFSYIAILDNKYVSRKKIILEILLITCFTMPPIFVNQNQNPQLFNLLFYIAILFYVLKLTVNVAIFRKYLNKATKELRNFYSEDSSDILRWINNSFFIVLTIGIVSTVVPITNIKVLLAYNIFLGAAYLYLYALIIRNVYTLFQKMNSISDNVELADLQSEQNSDFVTSENLNSEKYISQNLYKEWLNKRMYTQMGITAEETASIFCINRSKFSHYLKYELNTNYYQWIAKLRIEDAKRQLIDYPEKLISDIAIDVGIDDRSNFTRTFKKITGFSPQTYRSQYLRKKSR